jgi:hypothetical protein
MQTTLKDVFRAFPEVNEVYLDANDVVWLNKNTAMRQSPDGKFETITRLEIMGYIVFTLEPKDGETEAPIPQKQKRFSKHKKSE